MLLCSPQAFVGILEEMRLSLALLVRLLPRWFSGLDVPRALELSSQHGARLKRLPHSSPNPRHHTRGQLRAYVAERETRLYVDSLDRLRQKARELGLDDVGRDAMATRGARARKLESTKHSNQRSIHMKLATPVRSQRVAALTERAHRLAELARLRQRAELARSRQPLAQRVHPLTAAPLIWAPLQRINYRGGIGMFRSWLAGGIDMMSSRCGLGALCALE